MGSDSSVCLAGTIAFEIIIVYPKNASRDRQPVGRGTAASSNEPIRIQPADEAAGRGVRGAELPRNGRCSRDDLVDTRMAESTAWGQPVTQKERQP